MFQVALFPVSCDRRVILSHSLVRTTVMFALVGSTSTLQLHDHMTKFYLVLSNIKVKRMDDFISHIEVCFSVFDTNSWVSLWLHPLGRPIIVVTERFDLTILNKSIFRVDRNNFYHPFVNSSYFMGMCG